MRQSLSNLIQSAIIFEYQLPYAINGVNIPCAQISTTKDNCLRQIGTNDDIANIIYNGIVEYAYNDNEIDSTKLNKLQMRALVSKLKYNPNTPLKSQLAYGFQGEVMLHLILEHYYRTYKALARGYMYSPLENGETKGYDSYLMIEDENGLAMFFGEAKFYLSGYKDSLKSLFKSIDIALSDDYLERNFIALDNQYEHLNPNSKIPSIIAAWRENPTISIIDEVRKYNMHLVYPMLIIFDDKANTYNELIYNVITHINTKYTAINPTLSIPYTLFFILLPVGNSRSIKTQVLQWINQQQPLMP